MQTFDSEKFQINNNLQNSFNNSYKMFSNLKFEEERLNQIYLKIMSIISELNNIYGEKFNGIKLYSYILYYYII